ncbi:hypothetical protein [Schlesneria paludicola]|uniref:hypothetical protein n=1 Tax=Schlesneria paludicola TaxID=360056 RepID=UPI000299F5F3|nr:hypothetical protein [Schlesneria paludicola]
MHRITGPLLFLCIVSISGCGGESNEQRLKRLVPNANKTTKVTGNVTVNGQPGKDLWVTLHSTSGIELRPRAQCDDKGHFAIGTYLGDDGAPPGDYKITIEWLTFSRLGGAGWVGPDKLKDKYNDPKKTPFDITVADKPITLPTFELEVNAEEAANAKPKLRLTKER